MSDEAHEFASFFSRFAEIIGDTLTKVVSLAPFWWDGRWIGSNLGIGQGPEPFFKWLQVKITPAKRRIKDVILEKPKTGALVRGNPRPWRSADDRKEKERECLLVIINAQPVGARPKIGIFCSSVWILNQRVEGKD